MKRKSLLFLLLAAMFAPLAMNGQQTQTMTIGSSGGLFSTGNGSTSSFTPGSILGNTYCYRSLTQFIYTASEMGGAKTIKSVAFYHNNAGTFTTQNLTIYLAHTTASTISGSTAVTSGTAYYTGTNVTVGGNTEGWQTFTLDTDFEYNGTDNLLVVVARESSSGYLTAQGWKYTSTSSNYRYIYRTSDTNGYGTLSNDNGTYAYTQSYNRPNIQIGFTSTAPYITLDPASATVLTGFTETLTASYGNVSGTPTITYSSSNTSVATVSGSGTTATVTAVAPGTATITATLNGSYTATCDITVEDPSYCTPAPTSIDGSGMHPVKFGSGNYVVNNTTYPTSSPYYGDYSSQVGAYEAGETASVEMSFYTYGSWSGYDYGAVIWVDWNKDYEFSDSEIVNKGTSTTPSSSSSPGTLTLSFTVPATTAAGDYRMRIGAADSYFDSFISGTASAAHDPCYTGGYTCFHDYTLRVLAGGAYHITCNATTNGSISVDHGSADAGETITVTAVPETNYELTALSYNDGSDHNISFSNNQGTFTMPAADVTVSATFSIMRNLPPYDLTVGTPGGHSVELGWTGVSTNTNHQSFDLYYSTDPVMPQTPVQSSFIGGITASSYELTGLAPTTTYYAWVRDNCGTDGYSDWVAFTSFTTDVTCPAPTNLTANQVTNNSAVINWEGNAESYNLRYGTCAVDPNQPATIILTVGDVWEDGSGYQMLLDADATAYGTIIPETDSDYGYISTDGTIGGSTGNVLSSVYDEFEYKIPETADGALSTENIVINNTITIQIPAGTYDWCITNPTPGARMWIASSNGNIGGRADDYVFEGGKTYTFNLYLSGENDATDVTITCNNLEWTYVNNVTSPYTLEGLSPETDYVLDVQANCGSEDGTSDWVGTTFTTLDDCALPYELNTTNLTAASATLNWTGAQEAYNVRYHIAGEKLEEGFEGGSIPEGWTKQGSTWTVGQGAGTSTLTSTYEGTYNVKCSHSSSGDDYYLIMPAMDFSGESNLSLSLYYANPYYSSSYEDDIDGFGVYYRVNEGEWNELFYTTEKHNTWTPLTVALTGLAANYQIGFRMHDNWGGGVAIDNISLVISAGGEWVTKTNVTSPLNLDDLTPTIEKGNHYLPTNYEWQVQGVDCDGNGGTTDWSASATFTTPEGYVKEITGYGTGKGNWYLIASPIGTIANSDLEEKVINIFSNSYDLFYFDQAQKNEWVNYKDNTSGTSSNPNFGLEKGKGYLYANSNDVDLVFTGSALTTTQEKVQLAYTDTAEGYVVDLPGWNLVGNPFAVTAHITTQEGHTLDFYTLNATGDEFELATNTTIEGMEGVFVEAQENGEEITFTRGESAKGSLVALNLSKGRNIIDRAIVRFNECRQLHKVQLNPNHTKVYIPQDDQDYAVVHGEEMGEMPVSFKAEENGTYTLSFNAEEVSFGYLHLIDNMTGADVDLLQTPSYSFEARTTDYANRFKLVFATGSSTGSETFAFFSNGSFVINNEGEATLQVVDVMGRIVKSESINGCANINMNTTPGVYMLRLVNGDNVKVQKVVVK